MLIMHQLEKDVDVQMHTHMCYYRRLILAFGLDNTEMGGGGSRTVYQICE